MYLLCGVISLQSSLVIWIANPCHDYPVCTLRPFLYSPSWFYWPIKDLVLEEGATTAAAPPVTWHVAEDGQSCAQFCYDNQGKAFCDATAMSKAGSASSLPSSIGVNLVPTAGRKHAVFAPVLEDCSPLSPATRLADSTAYYHSKLACPAPCDVGKTWSASGTTPCTACAGDDTCAGGVKTACNATKDTVCNTFAEKLKESECLAAAVAEFGTKVTKDGATLTAFNSTLTAVSGGNDNAAKNLQACTGECDNDGQCATGLECFQRAKGEVTLIPGCSGFLKDDYDYCYDPKVKYPNYPSGCTVNSGGNYAAYWNSATNRPAQKNYSYVDTTSSVGLLGEMGGEWGTMSTHVLHLPST